MRSIGLEHETHGHGFVRVHMAQHISLTCVSNQRFESYYHIVKIASHDVSLQKTKAYRPTQCLNHGKLVFSLFYGLPILFR